MIPGGVSPLGPTPRSGEEARLVMDGDRGRSEAIRRERMENQLPMAHRYPQGYMMYSTN